MSVVVVVHPVKITKVMYTRDMVIDIEDEKIAAQLTASGAVRPLHVPSEFEVMKVSASAPTPTTEEASKIAELDFEHWCEAGNAAREYPPKGFIAQDTAAYRAYRVATMTPSMASEAMPQRVINNPGFMPVVREIK